MNLINISCFVKEKQQNISSLVTRCYDKHPTFWSMDVNSRPGQACSMIVCVHNVLRRLVHPIILCYYDCGL